MAINFGKINISNSTSLPLDPIDIFRRLPKPEGINDLYASQSDVLKQWNARRAEQDLVIKLHTGGGKTLVGLLIAKAIMNETQLPVVYLCPTIQLVKQTLSKAHTYSIPAEEFTPNHSDLPVNVKNAESLLICTYDKMFNGFSVFGVHGSTKIPIQLGGIIIDDAHVSMSALRQKFTLNIRQDTFKDVYQHITTLFAPDFEDAQAIRTYQDIISGLDAGNILEVPYWAWNQKIDQVANLIRRDMHNKDDFKYVWPLIRDDLRYCHCLISNKEISIVPFFPLVEKIPSFAQCKKRIYMSATISDDSSILRTYGVDIKAAQEPIKTDTVAGIGERMILIPELTKFGKSIDPLDLVKKLLKETDLSMNNKVVLTPSKFLAEKFADVANTFENSASVEATIHKIQTGTERGNFVFANRYDGIDLAGDACRILVLFGLPSGRSSYDLYRAKILSEDTEINNAIAQKLEQGLGRSTRGGADYSAVLLLGSDLIQWIGIKKHHRSLTFGTRAHLEMGKMMSETIDDYDSLISATLQCLDRDQDWINFHANTLASYPQEEVTDTISLSVAQIERKAFELFQKASYSKAVAAIQKFIEENPALDKQRIGWLKQYAACIAYYGNLPMWVDLQKGAANKNNHLYTYKNELEFVPIVPNQQAKEIAGNMAGYGDGLFKQAATKYVHEIGLHLTAMASSSQFEEALANLGTSLGFSVDRPDKKYRKGPDALWILNDKHILVIEAKNKKEMTSLVNKEEYGQLLASMVWTETNYEGYKVTGIIVAPNKQHTADVTLAENTLIVDIVQIEHLCNVAEQLINSLAEQTLDDQSLEVYCEKKLTEYSLKGDFIVQKYFTVI
jgi:replicative superfamily II helicase